MPPRPTSCRCASHINLNTSLGYQQSQNVKADGTCSNQCSGLFRRLTDVTPHPLHPYTPTPQHISRIAEPCETWSLQCSLPEGHVFACQHPLLSRPLLLIMSILSFPAYGGSHMQERVSQEEWTKLRETVLYVELYRYNPKHLYPKLNGYGDNGQRILIL